jgi:hypothetical protein
MSPSDQNDRKQQRGKTRGRKNWANSLVNPQTLKILMKVGPSIARALYWVYRIVELFRS